MVVCSFYYCKLVLYESCSGYKYCSFANLGMFFELKKLRKAPLIPHLFFSPLFWYLIGTTKKRTGEWAVTVVVKKKINKKEGEGGGGEEEKKKLGVVMAIGVWSSMTPLS